MRRKSGAGKTKKDPSHRSVHKHTWMHLGYRLIVYIENIRTQSREQKKKRKSISVIALNEVVTFDQVDDNSVCATISLNI